MDKKIAVSVIMPSLNVASYIRESIESVLCQTLENIEILCVDAGSTDGTLEILKEYAQQDARIKLVRSEKKSYGYQMNLGIRLSQGKYIGIVETDDLVDKHMFEELFKVTEEKGLDFVKTDEWDFSVQEDGKKKKWYVPLTTQSRYHRFYNQALCPGENLQVFTFTLHTWSGIYRRKFLLDNQIWHNESMGAAFQDNGFWFQTFMYAKRVMFLDKAYYMYRRDNPNSSIHHRGQIYAHRKEYFFLKNIIMHDAQKWEKFCYIYSWARFESFFFDLERIAEEHQLEFCEKTGQDFSEALKKGEVEESLFLKEHWEELNAIAENPEQYYNQRVPERNALLDKLAAFESIILYGAGIRGRQMFQFLTSRTPQFPVVCFAVTKKQEGELEVLGKPIYEIGDLRKYKESAAVLITTSKTYQNEIMETLKQQNFRHVFCAPVFQRDTSKEEKTQIVRKGDLKTGKEGILTPLGLREYIMNQYGESYLPALYGSWKQFSDIDFNTLPKAFVLGFSHYKDVELFIPDRENSDYMDLGFIERNLARSWQEDMGEEYRNVPKMLWAREFIGDISEGRILYRFSCKNGCVETVCVEKRDFQMERFNVTRSFYDCNWQALEKKVKYQLYEKGWKKPEGIETMLRIAGEIAEGFTELVIDTMHYQEKWYIMSVSLKFDK